MPPRMGWRPHANWFPLCAPGLRQLRPEGGCLVICGPGPAAAAMFRELDREAKVVPLTPTRIATIAGNYGVRVG